MTSTPSKAIKTITTLPFRATTDQACDWLTQQTGTPWSLARLIEHGVTPYVWLDYDPNQPALFGVDVVATGGYAAPIFFEGDTQRLAAGSDDVLITMTKDADKIVVKLPPPGLLRALDALRFLKKDIERLPKQIEKDAQAIAAEKAAAANPKESSSGLSQDHIITAFGSVVKFDLAQAMSAGIGIFSDDGARVKSSNTKKSKAQWNPVTLALGLHEVHRVPLSHLKRAFQTQACLQEWVEMWRESLDLLGK